MGYIHREVLTALFVIGAFWPASYGVSFLEEHIALVSTWFVSCLAMSTFTLLPAMKAENVNLILLGGALMVAVGIMYLLFEDFVLADFSSPVKPSSSRNHATRTLLGVQVGFIVLAIIITRSSALSLQAKQGLPLGNQILGWIVLGRYSMRYYLVLWLDANQFLCVYSRLPRPTPSVSHSTKQPLFTQVAGHIPHVRSYFCHSYHFLRGPFLSRLLRYSSLLGKARTRYFRVVFSRGQQQWR